MREVVSFVKQMPDHQKLVKSLSESESKIPKIEEEIIEIKKRLDDSETFLSIYKSEENTQIAALQSNLAMEKSVNNITDGISKIKERAFLKQNECEGLRFLLEAKQKELNENIEKLKDRDYLVSLAVLYSLYDKYNEQASALANTVKDLVNAYGKTESVARNCEAGKNFTAHINPSANRGIPEEIPAILFSWNTETTIHERFFWKNIPNFN